MNKKGVLAVGIIAIIGAGIGIGLIFSSISQTGPIDPLLLLILGPRIFNECPTISGVPDQLKIIPSWELNVTPYISDPDTPLFNLRLRTNSSYVTWKENDSGHFLIFTSYPSMYTEHVKIIVTDGICRASQTIEAGNIGI